MTRDQAAATIRANADAIIEQNAREAAGWDKGAYRDDDALRGCTIARWRRLVDQQVRELAPFAV